MRALAALVLAVVHRIAFLALLFSCAAPTATTPDTPDLDARVAELADAELATLVTGDVTRARIVVVDPRDGRVVYADALAADGSRDPNLTATEVRSHGSTGKTLALAAILAHDAVGLDETLDGTPFEIGGRRFEDWELHGPMTLGDGLALSSNVAFARASLRLGGPGLLETLGRLGLGARVVEGDDGAVAALASGESLEATSIEVAAAYAAIAGGGAYHAPWRRGDPASAATLAVSSEVAATVIDLLEAAVARDDATGAPARVPGLRVAGKTGTVREGETTFGVFVGLFPVEDPAWVVLVGVEATGDGYSGGRLAAPSFARLAARLVP